MVMDVVNGKKCYPKVMKCVINGDERWQAMMKGTAHRQTKITVKKKFLMNPPKWAHTNFFVSFIF